MKKKSTLKIFAAVFCIASSHAYSGTFIVPKPNETSIGPNHKTPVPPSVYDLDPLIVISQNVNEKGLVVMKGNFQKPNTSGDVKITIKYKDSQNNWVSVWCKTFAGNYEYNEDLTANFELPESTLNTHSVKVELSSDSSITNWQSITWNKTLNHYKKANYTYGTCDLDENQYTILFTPKKDGTVLYNSNGSVSGVKDRVTSQHLTKKLDDIVLSFQGNASLDNSNANSPIINITNPNGLSTIASSQKFIYQGSDMSPFEFSYHDPVYMFAGKFSNESFFINFSNWFLPPEEGGEPSGRGYLDFTNPNALVNRYYNLYNYINEKLGDVFTNQQPVVIVISKVTGLRVYKNNGQYVSLSATSNYDTQNDFGYPDLYSKHRGPGSENFSLSNTSQASLYGVGAIRNTKVISSWNGPSRPLMDIETEINKFIKYVGLFGNPVTEDCPVTCYTINSGAQSDYVDWTKAPNSYIFTGKYKKNNVIVDADGLYIPVKKAYEMWAKGGEFMKDEQGNYTKIPDGGSASAGLYWEDEMGLIKSVTLEGNGEDAKIKVLVNKLKEGNAVVSYKVNNQIYWTWHVWVTDDPRDGSTYHHGFEKDKNGNSFTDWKWMDRNLGATNAKLTGHDFYKTKGLQYQWGRKDPFPTSKIEGEAGKLSPGIAQANPIPVKFRGSIQPANAAGITNNTGFDSPNGNIRYSINNPINYIVPPVYIYRIGETPVNNGESYAIQGPTVKDWVRKDKTTWFSKSKYKNYDQTDFSKNVAWDLWGDPRGGQQTKLNTSDADLKAQSMMYAMKSPYDPCPCEWRTPSFYSSTAGFSTEPEASPWGKENDFYGGAVEISPTSMNSSFPGIKVYPSLGFDFTGVSGRNLGVIPINGNYEYYPQPMTLNEYNSSNVKVKDITRSADKVYLGMNANIGPEAVLQDEISDGQLHSSTFFTYAEPENTGTRGLALVSDPGNTTGHTSVGFHKIIQNSLIDGNAFESRGVRCIKDPNNAYMPTIFETEYVDTPASQYTLEQLKSWTKEPNSYIEYTNSTLDVPAASKDKIIDIPLRKAYAMNKLYFSQNNEMPAGSVTSFSVVWTTNPSLISNIEIIDGSSIENGKLRVTLDEQEAGNAVIAFHLGNSGQWVNGNNADPILWSWHIWAPKSMVQEQTEFVTETTGTGIRSANEQFVNPANSPYGVPLNTKFMDRDLGALMPFINEHLESSSATATSPLGYDSGNPNSANSLRVEQIRDSGGMHYQWGRKDPIPVFYNPGGFYNFPQLYVGGVFKGRPFNTYKVYRQNNLVSGVITYPMSGNPPLPVGLTNDDYLTSGTKSYSVYSNSSNANVLPTDNTENKIKKVLKYSVNNPFTFLYQTEPAVNESPKYDWLANENGLMTDRWGHSKEKSPYDPCPEGWRIPDLFESIDGGVDGLGLSYAKGNTPWYYQAKFNILQSNGSYKNFFGIDPTIFSTPSSLPSYAPNNRVYYENYNINKGSYIGGYVRAAGGGQTVRYGFVLNKPEYNIGNFSNNGIRGFEWGNNMDGIIPTNHTVASFYKSGVWSASPIGQLGKAAGMYFNVEGGSQSPNPTLLYYLTPSYAFNPQAGMSCRCAKIQYDGNGNEIGRYDPFVLAVPKNTTGKAVNTFAKKQLEEIQKDEKKLSVFPNPVKSLLYINADDKDYYYQIYNVSGQLVKEGKFENKKTDLSSLIQGIYLVRINNSETIVKIIKE
ncbi:T9SS type A sorting domain-containing protein [Chryseobacterium luteum]|uniref:Secretion system C-terminal sorting domain-containing protein n=1 Tax=Chryseobacterium luteum TaxID=421531 RepID=A0A085ZUX8_9FLAO|nr:T9SS type A sorting domain-containing protein [Chryseobacterium luteum]KFF08242.1 hypothetical protein IX38_05565 [Chryseobacterium luteum]